MEDCPKKPTPKDNKKVCKGKTLKLVKTWDDSSIEDEAHHKIHDHKHSSSQTSHVCIMSWGNVEILNSSESDSDNDY